MRNREYDPFARIYNRHWGADYRRQAEPVVARLLLSRLKPRAAVLDVCCGTGQFTRAIGDRGFRMAGLDASAEMIRYARRNAPGIPFTVADARDFRLPRRRFAAAYSVYESLNHIPDAAGLLSAFASIRRHLMPGAPFLFDLNREEAYQLHWVGTEGHADSDSAFMTQMDYDEASRTGTCRVTTFHASRGAPETWKRTDFTLHQTCHEIPVACDALEAAGFHDISLHDACDVGMLTGFGQGRTFFLALA